MATPFSIKDVLKVKSGDLRGIQDAMKRLAEKEVLVGFPEDTTVREDEGIDGISNASLGYIHDNGDPMHNIPARPFMIPGIISAQEKITKRLGSVCKQVLRDKNVLTADQGLHQVGLTAAAALKMYISDGVPPPLADATLRARQRKGKSIAKAATKELARRAQGEVPGIDLAKPLIETGAMRNAISYVIRKRKERK